MAIKLYASTYNCQYILLSLITQDYLQYTHMLNAEHLHMRSAKFLSNYKDFVMTVIQTEKTASLTIKTA